MTSCYTLLREQGYLISRQGARGVVALPSSANPPSMGITASLTRPDRPLVDLSFAALPAPPEVQDAYSAALEQLPSYLPTHGMDPLGIPRLREAIAARYTERGVSTDPTQIMVTPGAQHALRLLLNVFTAPGERVLVDHPDYPNALQAIRSVGARPVPVPVRPEGVPGWDLDGIRSAARQTAARTGLPDPGLPQPDRTVPRRVRAGRTGADRAGHPHDPGGGRVHGRSVAGRTAPVPVAATAGAPRSRRS